MSRVGARIQDLIEEGIRSGGGEALISYISTVLGESVGASKVSVSRGNRAKGSLAVTTVHGVLQAERGDGTEGLVLMAPFRTLSGEINSCGIAHVLSSAVQFSRYKFWARDIVILIPGIEESLGLPIGDTGRNRLPSSFALESLEDWLYAYHYRRSPERASSVGEYDFASRGGALQAAISLEINGRSCAGYFGDIELYLEGPDGLLPNLDLVNINVMLETHRGGSMKLYPRGYADSWLLNKIPPKFESAARLVHLVGMLMRQALGYPIFAHGPFLKYRIDAITLALFEAPLVEKSADSEGGAEAGSGSSFDYSRLPPYSDQSLFE